MVSPELAVARAKASEDMALIAQQKPQIANLERQVYGRRAWSISWRWRSKSWRRPPPWRHAADGNMKPALASTWKHPDNANRPSGGFSG
jgi:hypothetical protein